MKKNGLNNAILILILVILSIFSCSEVPSQILENYKAAGTQTDAFTRKADNHKKQHKADRIYSDLEQTVVIVCYKSSISLDKKETGSNFSLFLAILFKIVLFSYLIFYVFNAKEQRLFTILFRILQFIHKKDGKKREAAFLHV